MAEIASPPPPAPDPNAWLLANLPRAVAYAASLLNDRTTAEDVVHDCVCRLLRKSHEYDLPRDGVKLLYRSITNACINQNTRRRPHLSLFAGDDEPAAPTVADVSALEPVHDAVGKELEEAVASGLQMLPTNQRAALELKSLGHSMQEIARALDTSTGNAAVLVHRARQTLARHLSPFLEGMAE